MHGQWRPATGRFVLAMLLMALAVGCARGEATPKGALVNVRMDDYKLEPSFETVPAGFVTFRVDNPSPSTHELVVARTSVAADALPLRANGIAVNEDSKKIRAVADVGEIRLNTTHDLTLKLKAGHYVLFCNLEGHYRGGMYATVEVT
jgi:uncharacterized cupredoxin-like copper-binding protein